MALSTILVIAAGIFLRTVLVLNSVNLGFDPNHVLLFEIHPPAQRYANGKDIQLHLELEQKFAALAGVVAVAAASNPIAADNMSNSEFVTEDDGPKAKTPPEFDNIVGNDYFRTMRIPIVAGRSFGVSDTATSPQVAIINQALAQKRFPKSGAIGKRFRVEDGAKTQWIQVVGICANTRYANVKDAPPPVFYVPYVQQTEAGDMTYQIRTNASAATLVPALRRIVQQIDPDLPIIDIRTEREQINATIQMERMFAVLTSSFGLLALSLACVGIYGIIAYTVAQRTQRDRNSPRARRAARTGARDDIAREHLACDCGDCCWNRRCAGTGAAGQVDALWDSAAGSGYDRRRGFGVAGSCAGRKLDSCAAGGGSATDGGPAARVTRYQGLRNCNRNLRASSLTA